MRKHSALWYLEDAMGRRSKMKGLEIRVRGTVQGVGFRPTVWRLARELGLAGEVLNDGAGVLIRAWGDAERLVALQARLLREAPPLAHIESIEQSGLAGMPPPGPFRIAPSASGSVRTGVSPDAASCASCLAEIADPGDRRFRYPFTNCTHCGPRLSIIRSIPYDRANTSMASFTMCPACRQEYEAPPDRRFHAQPNACPVCGPRTWLEEARSGEPVGPREAIDAVAHASRLLREGCIVAIKGIGGFHLACDARDEEAVARLRARKRRHAKPFALMVRDLATADRYAVVTDEEREALRGPAAPIVLLPSRREGPGLASALAPGQATLGIMLPYTPLHTLLLEDWDSPLVMTSGNVSDEPQCVDNRDARERLRDIADYLLLHDREIVNRVDDSVVRRTDGSLCVLRRARGYAPSPLPLAAALAGAPPVLALGGELKNAICLLSRGEAVVSQHLGDLENAATADEYERCIRLYRDLYRFEPEILAVDAHPDYRSTRLGREWALRAGLSLEVVQHHHAHAASVLAENRWSTDAPPVIAVVLDGLGYGLDECIWGGEFLLAGYGSCERLAHLKYAPMPGGTKAILEPWRNTFAQIVTHFGWDAFHARWGGTELSRWLETRPLDALRAMLERGVNSPQTSSCGRLFDAVAAALGVCRDMIHYEGQAAIELEALATTIRDEGGYGFAIGSGAHLAMLDPAPCWEELFDDLARGTDRRVIAARFHRGLARAIADLATRLARTAGLGTVALSGGVLQNRLLHETLAAALRARGLDVLCQRRVPSNDGGLSLGQAAVAAARGLSTGRTQRTPESLS